MAGMTIDPNVFYNALQEEYGPELHYNVNNETFGFQQIDTATGFTFAGKRVVEAVTASYVASSGFYGQIPQSMPTPGDMSLSPTYIQQCVGLFNLRADWVALAKTSARAFANVWTAAFETLQNHRKLEMERITFGNGNGVLNRVTQSGGTGIRSIGTVTAVNWTFTIQIWDAPNFRPGMQVWFATGTLSQAGWRTATKRDTPNQGYYTIGAVVPAPATNVATVTIKEASPNLNPPVNGDYVIVAGSIFFSTTNTGNEPMGLDGIISQENAWLQHNVASDTLTVDTFQGIDATANGFWNAARVAATGTLNKNHMATLSVNMNVFGTASAANLVGWFIHPAQEQAYAASLEGAERIMVMGNETPQVPSGRTSILNREGIGPSLTYSGKPFLKGRFVHPQRVYGFNKRGAKKYYLQEAKFEARHQDFGGRPAWQMDGMEILNIGTTDRACNGVIDGLTLPAAS